MPKSGWRKHQLDIDRIAQKIVAQREDSSHTFTEIVAGGGKSRNAVIMGHRLREAGLIDKIIWVTPRLSLQKQGAEAALAGVDEIPGFLLGDTHRSAGADGFVTNYMALRSDPKTHFDLLNHYRNKGSRVLLVADEAHYCAAKSGYLAAWADTFRLFSRRVREGNGHQLSMSGTVRRWDDNPVLRAPYPGFGIDTHLDHSRSLIYDRDDGIAEAAITRLRFHSFDGLVQWNGPDGPETSTPVRLSDVGLSSALPKKLSGRALRAFIHGSNMESVHKPAIMDAIASRRRHKPGWLRYRERYGNNQIIITVDRQRTAKALIAWLNSRQFRSWIKGWHRSDGSGPILKDDFRAVLAVSDSVSSLNAIHSFRTGRLLFDSHVGRAGDPVHCLVTVAMAHVGMDAPSATHLVHLGDTRSIPWLTQVFARVWRTGAYEWPKGLPPVPPEERVAQIWAPADWRMAGAVEAISDSSYAKGQGKKQRAGGWDSLDWDEMEPLPKKEPEEKKAAKPRVQYNPVPGACSVDAFNAGEIV